MTRAADAAGLRILQLINDNTAGNHFTSCSAVLLHVDYCCAASIKASTHEKVSVLKETPSITHT